VRLCVCASVCLFVREHHGTAGLIRAKFCVQIPCGRGSDGVALRYVLPVLWMTSRLAVVGRVSVHGLSVAKSSVYTPRRCETGAESDVYECLACLVKNMR